MDNNNGNNVKKGSMSPSPEKSGSSSSSPKYLTYEGLIETVGASAALDTIQDLEILFLTFEEICPSSGSGSGNRSTSNSHSNMQSVFIHLPALERLALLDNGLKRISGLESLANTLINLTICDQMITNIDHGCLNLPNLRQLYLHRNELTSLKGLSGVPRLQKLWIFQNKLTSLKEVHALPELTCLWAQANQIKNLNGVQLCSELNELCLAGNPISDFVEIKRLKKLKSLTSLSLNDVHFGRCPLTDEKTYRSFILTALRQLRTLDDVAITKENTNTAISTLNSQAKIYGDQLSAIESEYQSNLSVINNRYSSKESHLIALEKEMQVALTELSAMVSDGRESIKAHINHHEELMNANLLSLQANLQNILHTTVHNIDRNQIGIKNEYDLASSLFVTLERVLVAEHALTSALCKLYADGIHCSNPSGGSSGKPNKGNKSVFAFQTLPSSSPDFHLFASQIQNGTASQGRPASASSSNSGASSGSNANIQKKSGPLHVLPLELARYACVCRCACVDVIVYVYVIAVANLSRCTVILTRTSLQIISTV